MEGRVERRVSWQQECDSRHGCVSSAGVKPWSNTGPGFTARVDTLKAFRWIALREFTTWEVSTNAALLNVAGSVPVHIFIFFSKRICIFLRELVKARVLKYSWVRYNTSECRKPIKDWENYQFTKSLEGRFSHISCFKIGYNLFRLPVETGWT